jgi:hypothetical protein
MGQLGRFAQNRQNSNLCSQPAILAPNADSWQRSFWKWAISRLSRAFGANKIFCYSFLMNTASLFADPDLLQQERVSAGPERITLIVKTAVGTENAIRELQAGISPDR